MIKKLGYILPVVWLFVACSPPKVTQSLISVILNADGKSFQLELPAGTTVQQAFLKAGITLSNLDRSEPSLYSILSDGSSVRLIRVREEFDIEQVTIPFEHQMVQNESLPVGETRLSQPGENGLQEITYRRLYEDGVEISRSEVKTSVIKEAVPEIIMVGSQTPFTSIQITGRLAYLSAGNAWVMEKTTGNRRAVVTTGDLDGRIFSLSPDGNWLLFTRSSDDENRINSLWAVRLDDDDNLLVDLKAENIIHFAEFAPDSITIAYSTVEPRTTSPGWQANNDLILVGVSASGFASKPRTLIETNSGGVYGWWGTEYAWAPDGQKIAYARPDGIGLVMVDEESLISPVKEIIPLQTGGDWAWIPAVDWAPDGKTLYLVDHLAGEGSASAEESPLFDLVANPLEGGPAIDLSSQVGMFAYPTASPMLDSLESSPIGNSFSIGYLQAITPAQSETSRYRLAVSDRDGSNTRVLFPADGAQGLDPQRIVWSPSVIGEGQDLAIAVIYQNDIWIVNSKNGEAQQITGDGLTVRIDWR